MLEFVRVQKDNRIGRALRVPHFWKLAFTIRLHFWMHVNVWPNVFTVEQQRLTMLVAYSAVWLCDCYRGKVFPGPDLQSVQSYFQKPTSTAARPEIIIVLLSNKEEEERGRHSQIHTAPKRWGRKLPTGYASRQSFPTNALHMRMTDIVGWKWIQSRWTVAFFSTSLKTMQWSREKTSGKKLK